MDDDLVQIREELAGREARTRRQPGEIVREVLREARHVVEGGHVPVTRRNDQVLAVARLFAYRRLIRVDELPHDAEKGRLRGPLLAVNEQDGIRPARPK